MDNYPVPKFGVGQALRKQILRTTTDASAMALALLTQSSRAEKSKS